MKLKTIAYVGVMAAFICVIAPLAIPIGPVPISLATFAVMLVSCVSDWKLGLAATAVYIVLGAAGVPVFAGFSAGLQRLVGVTGGYIWGYLLLSLATGLICSGRPGKFAVYPASMALGTALLYLCGTIWYCAVTRSSALAALSVCVVPFLPGDAVKIAAASAAGFRVRKIISGKAKA